MDACTPPEPNRAAENGPGRDNSLEAVLSGESQGRYMQRRG